MAKIGTPPKEKLKKAGIEAVDTYALEIIEPSAIAHFKDYLEKHERGEVERKPLATPGSLFRGRFFSLGQAARVISVCCQSAAMRVWYKPKTQGQARSRSGGAAVIQRDSPREAVQRAQGRRCVRVPTNGDISAMIIEIGAVAAVTGGVTGAMSIRRARHYKRLAARLDKVKQTSPSPATDFSRQPVPSFANRIAAIPNFLEAQQFANLKAEVEALSGAERSYVPTPQEGRNHRLRNPDRACAWPSPRFTIPRHGGLRFAHYRR